MLCNELAHRTSNYVFDESWCYKLSEVCQGMSAFLPTCKRVYQRHCFLHETMIQRWGFTNLTHALTQNICPFQRMTGTWMASSKKMFFCSTTKWADENELAQSWHSGTRRITSNCGIHKLCSILRRQLRSISQLPILF